jgi:hypothetical protein
LTLYGDVIAVPMTVPSTMKSTRVMVTPVPAVGIAVSDTIRFTVAPGDASETDDGVVIPPVFPPMPLFIAGVVYMLPPLPPHAASIVTNTPTTPNIETFITLTLMSFIGDFPCSTAAFVGVPQFTTGFVDSHPTHTFFDLLAIRCRKVQAIRRDQKKAPLKTGLARTTTSGRSEKLIHPLP